MCVCVGRSSLSGLNYWIYAFGDPLWVGGISIIISESWGSESVHKYFFGDPTILTHTTRATKHLKPPDTAF